MVARWVDGVVVVVAAHQTPRALLETALDVVDPGQAGRHRLQRVRRPRRRPPRALLRGLLRRGGSDEAERGGVLSRISQKVGSLLRRGEEAAVRNRRSGTARSDASRSSKAWCSRWRSPGPPSRGAIGSSWTGVDVAAMLGQAGAVSLCCIVAFYYNDLYDLRVVRSFSLFASRLLQSFGVALILLALFYTIVPDAGMTERALRVGPAGGGGPARARSAPSATWSCGVAHSPTACSCSGRAPWPDGSSRRSSPGRTSATRWWASSTTGAGPSAGDLPYPVLGPLERLDKIIDDVKPDRLIVALTERRGRMPMAPAARLRRPWHPGRGRPPHVRVLHGQAPHRVADPVVPDLLGRLPEVAPAAGPAARDQPRRRGDRPAPHRAR